MGKRNKRARTMLKKMSILNEIPDIQTAKKYGIEEQVNARIRLQEENSMRIQKLKEAQEAEEQALRLKAETEARRKEAAKKAAENKKKQLKAPPSTEVTLDKPAKKTTTSKPRPTRRRKTTKTNRANQ